jgi:putative transposase
MGKMRRFKSAGHVQRFLSAFAPIRGHFRLQRHNTPAAAYYAQRRQRFERWNEVAAVQMVI